ncbi:peptidoglycan recognition family protein [Bacillus sp. FJAT-50079]|uniref:peptidoglycan recognition protein family protein n=1 Tax=Bacillus sp. FJAT-50079 TaxID=2833577 RepID=UPI001BC8E7FE|nr:N-acetylmuramoyl-L-alanine amidase [Bacillus sp. FJAT-50079]
MGTGVKDTIVIHHSMTAMQLRGSTPQGFANTHIDTNCWPGIAYPFVIMPDGTIYQCDDLDRRTYHAGDTNTRSIGICVVGDFRKEGAKEVPTTEQMQSVYLLVKELQNTLPKLTRILGHQECPDYSWKNCPGDTWNFKDVIAGKYFNIKKDERMINLPIKKGNTYDSVKLINGFLAALGHISREDFEREHFDHWREKGVQRFQQAQKIKNPKPGEVDYETFIAFAKVLTVYHDHWIASKK